MTATLSLCRHKRTSPMAEEFPSNRRASTDEGRKSSWPRTAQNLAELFVVNHGRDSSMPKLKLTYFDFHGGRGEPARLALSIAGIPFEDDRVSGADWPRRKPSTPFGSVPVLEADGPITFFLTRLQQRLEAGGGQYFAGGRLSVADLKVFVWIRHLRSGKLDYIPADLPDRVAAKLVAHFERVKNHPGMKAYYAKHGIAE